MGRRCVLNFMGEKVEGEELDFQTAHEEWNEYKCSDGSVVRVKTVVLKIVRLDKTNPDGEPIYMTRSSNVVSVSRATPSAVM